MKISRLLLYILPILFFCSCGEDRSFQYYDKTENDHWIDSVMLERYLWYEEIADVSFNDYFAKPEEFLKKIVFNGNSTMKADVFSYVEYKDTTSTAARSYIQSTSTYGFDFDLIQDPTQKTSHYFARVLFVLPDSPASQVGLKRGDWIADVNDERITTSNYDMLMYGDATTFDLQNLVDTDGTLSWTSGEKLNIGASRKVENDPFYVDSTYTVDGKKIAYLVYNKFSTGPDDQSTDNQYFDEMKQIFSKFKSESPDAFILDLRYNPGGYLTCAQELASMLAPSSALGKAFLTLEYNNKTTPQTGTYKFREDLSAYNLNLSKIYIITSNYTASASEAVINCLKPYMSDENVITLGTTTYGKNVAMEPFTKSNLNFILWPVTAYVLNANGFGDYRDGITPTYSVSEATDYNQLMPLGNTDELLLKNAISLITTGSLSSATVAEENNNSISKSSITVRNQVGLKIK